MSVPSRQPDASLGQLVSGATAQMSSLVKLELELAQAEVKAQVQQGAAGGGLAAAAGVIAFVAFLLLSVAAALALALVLPWWAGFLIVGGAYLLLAGLLGFLGVRHFKRIKGLQQTQASVAETQAMLKRHLARRAPESA